ncbi:MAG: formylglycine-generating enzyme family protein [Prevotellaceae bacterium]|jgi:formylglycine-generating enzyme required for sulfatase activity|nr:formylglycine-generating enzyme family protein [Prevotellaceae bacterium]
MKQSYKIYLCALLLIGATGTMTAGAQGSGKPTLVVFVVGMQTDALGDALAQKIGAELNRNSRYTMLSGAADPVKAKLTELRTQGARSIDRNALAEWGRTNGISTICLVTDDIKGNDHMFLAQLIDTKDSKLSGKGRYIRTGIVEGDLPRVSLALTKQLEGPERKRSAPAPARSYPAELDIEMVRVEGGTFTMGCTAEQVNCKTNELPLHSVAVSNFSIGKYPITQAQWNAVMAGTGKENYFYWGGNAADTYTGSARCGNVLCDDQRPMEYITWYEAVEFCNVLSGKLGLKPAYAINQTTVTLNSNYNGYRLPMEAEWEYAARGCKGDGGSGAATCENLLYSGSNDVNEVGWHIGNSSTTHPVGQKKPNRLGIYDMSGNVWDWIYDWYDAYTNAAATNPKGPESGTYRVIRGGGWDNPHSEWLRVFARYPSWSASNRNGAIGFRVVLPAQ